MRRLTRQQVAPICHQLEALGWLDNFDERGTKLTGKINPRVHVVYAERAASEVIRRDGVKASIKKMAGK
jgi:hypothetical protein